MGQTNDKPSRRAQSAPRTERSGRFNDVRFVQYELDEVQRKQCKAWDLSGDDLWLESLSLLDDGYTFSLKYDEYSQSYACFVQVRNQPDHVNAGFILAGRGSTPAKALKQALFKHRAIDAAWAGYGERRSQVVDD